MLIPPAIVYCVWQNLGGGEVIANLSKTLLSLVRNKSIFVGIAKTNADMKSDIMLRKNKYKLLILYETVTYK